MSSFAVFCLAGKIYGIRQYAEEYWQSVAVLCRYGHMGLQDVMSMPRSDAEHLTRQILKLVSEENKSPNSND